MNSQLSTQPHSPIDARMFRDALGTFPTGVAVITTLAEGGEPVGLTCNSFSSVSLDPPLVSWSLRKASKSIEIFRKTESFTINILADDQSGLSARFSSSKISDKFSEAPWHPGHGGAPVIEQCLASFECATHAVHEAGDHLLFIGHVKRFEQGRQDDPLVFYKGAYMMLTQSLRELVASGHAAATDLAIARRHLYKVLLGLACESGTTEDFDGIERQLDLIDSFTAPSDIERRMQSGVRFFRLIAEASHNQVLNVVADSLNTLLQHTLKSRISEARKLDQTANLVNSKVVPLRRQILNCLRARDIAGVEAAFNEFQLHSSLETPEVSFVS